MGLPYGSIPRKTVPRDEQSTAMDYAVLFEFGVRNVAIYLNLCISAYAYTQQWMRTDTQFVNMHTFLCIAVFQCSWTNWSRHRTFLKKKKNIPFCSIPRCGN